MLKLYFDLGSHLGPKDADLGDLIPNCGQEKIIMRFLSDINRL
jgi:hypothetical protein